MAQNKFSNRNDQAAQQTNPSSKLQWGGGAGANDISKTKYSVLKFMFNKTTILYLSYLVSKYACPQTGGRASLLPTYQAPSEDNQI